MATTVSYNVSETVTTWGNISHISEHPTYVIIRRIQTVLFPIIVIVGGVGNCFAVGSFFSQSLRKTSCCLYLGVKSLSDVGFLVTLLMFFLQRVRVSLLCYPGICQVTVFLTYFCPFLSIWLVVMISFENCIRISQPALVHTFCTTTVAKKVILAFVTVGLGVYNFTFWTTRVRYGQCLPTGELAHVIRAFTYVDTVLTLVVPLLIMLILVPLVSVSALSAYKRKQRLVQGHKRKKSTSTPEAQVTRMLFAVSVSFFLFHMPSHVFRIKEMIMYINTKPTYQDMILQRIFELVYYLDFCVSLLVYLVFGKNFRKVFVGMYFQRCSSKNQSTAL